VKSINGHRAEVRSIAFSPNGKLMASASADQTIKLWNREGVHLSTLKGHANAVWSVAFSPDSPLNFGRLGWRWILKKHSGMDVTG
jgi:WD40 repeat protein